MTDLADPPRLRVDVWSDVVCPWCHIGLANLDAALAELDGADRVDVVLHSFQLDPRARSTTPDEHVEAIAFWRVGFREHQVFNFGQRRLVVRF